MVLRRKTPVLALVLIMAQGGCVHLLHEMMEQRSLSAGPSAGVSTGGDEPSLAALGFDVTGCYSVLCLSSGTRSVLSGEGHFPYIQAGLRILADVAIGYSLGVGEASDHNLHFFLGAPLPPLRGISLSKHYALYLEPYWRPMWVAAKEDRRWRHEVGMMLKLSWQKR